MLIKNCPLLQATRNRGWEVVAFWEGVAWEGVA